MFGGIEQSENIQNVEEELKAPIIEIETINVKPGEETYAFINMSSGIGISSGAIKLNFDSRLEYIESIETSDITSDIQKDVNGNSLQIGFLSNEEIKERKTIAILKFRLPQNAKLNDTYNLEIASVNSLFSSNNGDVLSYRKMDANIISTGGEQVQEEQGENIKSSILKIVLIIALILILVLIIFGIIKKVKNKK